MLIEQARAELAAIRAARQMVYADLERRDKKRSPGDEPALDVLNDRGDGANAEPMRRCTSLEAVGHPILAVFETKKPHRREAGKVAGKIRGQDRPLEVEARQQPDPAGSNTGRTLLEIGPKLY